MRNTLLVAMLYFTLPAFSQSVINNVHFDNYVNASDNDLFNYFSGFASMQQVPAGGIAGGSVIPPDSVNPGINAATYCTYYKGQAGGLYITSIAFRYDTTLLQQGTGDRLVLLSLQPSSDFNHYLMGSIMQDRRIQIISYSWVNPSGIPLPLVHGNWYRFTLQASYAGGASGIEISAGAAVHDLGPSGISAPVLLDNATGSFDDAVLFQDSLIAVSMNGSTRGGASHLDDFHFEGIAGQSTCLPAAVIEEENTVEAEIRGNTVYVNSPFSKEISIFSVTGALLYNETMDAGSRILRTGDVCEGLFAVRIISGKSTVVLKGISLKE